MLPLALEQVNECGVRGLGDKNLNQLAVRTALPTYRCDHRLRRLEGSRKPIWCCSCGRLTKSELALHGAEPRACLVCRACDCI